MSLAREFNKEERKEMSSRMSGMKPAHEQSFDFDDHMYAQAPGSHGGGMDNSFVPPR